MGVTVEQTSSKIIRGFDQLQQALIDTSSIIYTRKAGYFDALSSAIQLYSIPEVVSEVKTKITGVTLIRSSERSFLSTDRKLMKCALKNRLAIISEDKTILSSMRVAGVGHYNALMMLNFLLYVRRIDDKRYQPYYHSLKSIARYSDQVWEVGEELYSAIKSITGP